MSFRATLSTRWSSLQEDISHVTTGVKNFSVGVSSSTVSAPPPPLCTSLPPPSSPEYRPPHAAVAAGCNILQYYQNDWSVLHDGNEWNVRLASECDTVIASLHADIDKKWNDAVTLQMLLAHLPNINQQIQQSMKILGQLESTFSDVEVALLALEDTIDARELQEKQLEQRFQLAMCQEKRKAEYNQLASRLNSDYQRKKQESERLRMSANKERQNQLKLKFQEDMEKFANSPHLLKVPKGVDPDASLETVDLNEDDSALEAFLQDTISPLPHDDDDDKVLISHVSLSSPDVDAKVLTLPGTSEVTPDEQGLLAVSRTESLYFTPDTTMEKLNNAQ